MSQGAGGGRILVVGDVMTDIIVKPEGPLVRGSDRRASIRSRPGGSGANQAVWLGAMGTRVSFVARVGAADKPHLEAYFKGFCVDPVLVADALLPSGMLVTIVDPDGERSFLTDRGANLALSPSDMPVWLLDDTSMVLVSGYSYFADGPRRAVHCLTEEARRRGIPLAVDAASAGFLAEVGAADFLAWTGGVDLLLCNGEEAAALSGTGELDAQMRLLGQHFPRVVVKRGALGAALGGRAGVAIDLPAPAVEVVDTTGAGDAFAAAFLSAELAGRPPEACLAAGIAAGSAAVGTLGGQPGQGLIRRAGTAPAARTAPTRS
ncbi:MAG: PfkB family carbohydrate kinase [Thiobacillus sp.]|uniref:carbohydrate kinase family protein n=1 Tax=Thiobacillus sp. TaxID=924 RepID=UPI0028960C6E|nr:PfkB family carbohydrate kinase [Thiobacillus sp.]MDT3707303.1 PfkB family carbohydrate kinase [Thiobacillus sp.]